MDAIIEPRGGMDIRSEIALRVINLTKTYRMYAQPEDRLKQALMRNRRRYFDEYTAVDDVSFDVQRGETVGLVGRNGSGKSTVLQMIAGTLNPSSGSIERHGRIAALLELGAGFNPDFTGRENARLNAAIFGMDPGAIDDIYPRIVEFADIGRYIEQPVKTYSSGMYVRLAFATAVAVDPDILIVDEALSVGDAAFQRKCFARIHEIQARGATILFVSHQTSSVIELCSRAMLMEGGKLLLADRPKTVVGFYNRLLYDTGADRRIILGEITARQRRAATGKDSERIGLPEPGAELALSAATTTAAEISDEESHYYDPNLISQSREEYASRGAIIHEPHIETLEGRRVNVLRRGCRYTYRFRVSFHDSFEKVRFGMFIRTMSGFDLGGSASFPPSRVMPAIEADRTVMICFTFDCLLLPGAYFMNAGASAVIDGERVFLHRLCDALMFRVMEEADLTLDGIVDFRIEPKVKIEEAV